MSDEKCEHCHGSGHHVCKECEGKGKKVCSKCGGEKRLVCSKCHGKGKHSNCSRCDSTGKVDCGTCGGSGRVREECPNCRGMGKAQKTRLRNCGHCHGTGESDIKAIGGGFKSCSYCRGTGQVEERYYDTCPTCGGSGKGREVTCSHCHGKGEVTCSRCHGTGHAVCSNCEGSGKVDCSECGGKGAVVCQVCHGGGDRVCVECYGTGDKPQPSAKVKSGGMEKVKEGTEKYKAKNYVAAFELYRQAAVDYKTPAAFRRLGRMYESGTGIKKNEKRANILYRIAANAGDLKALWFLGVNYAKGIGAEKDKAEARRLLEVATVKGCSEAQDDYKKVAATKLVPKAVSGVVGWQKSITTPDFVLEADPAAEAAAEKARQIEKAKAAPSSRNRTVYVLLGIFLGWCGAHFIYAKRIGWLILEWLFLVGGLVQRFVPSVDAFIKGMMNPLVEKVQQSIGSGSNIWENWGTCLTALMENPLLSLAGFVAIWGVLFVRRDGGKYHNRMRFSWLDYCPDKKLFILIWLIGNLLGAHLAYALRWKLFAIYWGMNIALVAIGWKIPSLWDECGAQAFVLNWLILGVSSVFWVKKDRYGRKFS